MNDSLFAKTFGDSLQRQLNQDIGDMCTEMAVKNTYNRGIKIQPAYENVDVFQRQQVEQVMRIHNDRREVTAAKGRLIQPDDPSKPKVRVILPNE